MVVLIADGANSLKVTPGFVVECVIRPQEQIRKQIPPSSDAPRSRVRLCSMAGRGMREKKTAFPFVLTLR